MIRQFPPFRSERKKRTTSGAGENEVIMVSCSGGSLEFPNGFSRKL